MKRLLICALGFACLSPVPASSEESATNTTYLPALRAVPAGELPAESVELVLRAKPLDRPTATVAVVKAAISINPAAVLSIVGAVARAVPDVADIAAGTAAAEQPKQATAIAKAAAAAAPSQAAKIVAAICRAVPKDYRSVAIAVAQTVPGSNRDILKAVASAIPELKAGVEDALATYSGNAIPVAMVLDQASVPRINQSSDNESTVRGPAVAPPFIPIGSTVRTITPSTSGDVPTGGRDYGTP